MKSEKRSALACLRPYSGCRKGCETQSCSGGFRWLKSLHSLEWAQGGHGPLPDFTGLESLESLMRWFVVLKELPESFFKLPKLEYLAYIVSDSSCIPEAFAFFPA